MAIRCKIFDKIEDSPARRLYITSYHGIYGCDGKITFKELDNNCKFLCAYSDGKPVGMIAYVTRNGKTNLDLVYVMKKYRKKGIMRKMFKYLLKSKRILQWNAAVDAIPAYDSIGARRTNKTGSKFTMTKKDFKKTKKGS